RRRPCERSAPVGHEGASSVRPSRGVAFVGPLLGRRRVPSARLQALRPGGLLARLRGVHRRPTASMRVRYLDLTRAYQELEPNLSATIARVLASGRYLLGPELEAFERAFAAYTGTRHCVGVGCGLDALRVGLRALGVGLDDEVLVPSNTYFATWLAVIQVGAIPVPVEPDTDTFNIDAKRMEAAVTRRTRAVIPVHLYGQP